MSNLDQHKVTKFLHNMVTVHVLRYRNIERDAKVIALSERIKEQTGRADGAFMVLYAQRLVYTDKMEFDWHPETPIEYMNLEKWWHMVESGEDEIECYLFYISNISNEIANEWQNVLINAHEIWKPPKETAEESSDPN